MGIAGPWRECRRDRHRRWIGHRLQDGKPQPSVLHRALSGRDDRGGRHPARCLHHGRAAHRRAQRPALRRAGPSAHAPACGRCRRRYRGLRQLVRRADGWRLGRLRCPLQRQHSRQCHGCRDRKDGCDLPRQGNGRGQGDRLSRLQDRTRRHSRRDHGVRRIRRQLGREAPHRSGRRSVCRKAATGSLPRNHGQGLR